MLDPCIQGLNIKKDGVYVDVTFGGGGHSKAILNELGEEGRLYAFDQDTDAAANIPDDPRLVFINHNFKFIAHFLEYLSAVPVDGVLADLGISSYQIDAPDKGFAHRFDGNLDMRMDKNGKVTAADIINHYSERELLKVFRTYGEIKNAYKLVKSILDYRKTSEIKTTTIFKEAIRECIPATESKYLSQVYQALRIEVNEELKALEVLLKQSPEIIKVGGRLVIMSYHSLEDRMVKNFISSGNIEGELKKDEFGRTDLPFKSVTRKAIQASEEEIERNKRARSARLRIAERI